MAVERYVWGVLHVCPPGSRWPMIDKVVAEGRDEVCNLREGRERSNTS